MHPSRVLLSIVTVAALAPALVAACADLTPITLEAPDSSAPPRDAAVPDGPSDDAASDADLRSVCTRCLEGTDDAGVCETQFVACASDPICKAALQCSVDNGCLELQTPQEVVGCGLPCAADAGLRSQFDPPAVSLLNLVNCGQQRCTGFCVWSKK